MTKELFTEMMLELGEARELSFSKEETERYNKRAKELVDYFTSFTAKQYYLKGHEEGFDQAVVKMLQEGYRR